MLFRTVAPPEHPATHEARRALVSQLKTLVCSYAVPRSRTAEARANQQQRDALALRFSDLGYVVELQGPYFNVVARRANRTGPVTLLAAHYDSVPNSPGADDNASGVAAMLAVAEKLAKTNSPVAFCAFNAEEEGLRGSQEFVHSGAAKDLGVQKVHVLEMLGFWTKQPHSQEAPGGLPLPELPEHGDFLGLVANHGSNKLLTRTLDHAAALRGGPKLVGLGLPPGIEKLVTDVLRSDHANFWSKNIPALLWTDTAEFRNPHYHQTSDTPETLDYEALARVTELLALVLDSTSTKA